MVLQDIKTAFYNSANEYKQLLDRIYPAKNSSGFTERNLTYRFCKHFESICDQGMNSIVFSWMEFPLPKYKKANGKRVSTPHIDAVIFVFSREKISIIYIEAKRITENNYNKKYRSIIADIERMKSSTNRSGVLDHIDKKHNTKKIDEYVCFLADVWIGNKKRSLEVPGWWKSTLPQSIGPSQKQMTFFAETKQLSKCSYNLLGLVEQL